MKLFALIQLVILVVVTANMVTNVNLLLDRSCNLNCEFCFLKNNKAFKRYDENILDAWKSGKYLNNIKTYLGSDIDNVRMLQIWGGEPLLKLDVINVPNLCETFKYIDRIIIPTNFTCSVNKLITFLKQLNKYTSHNVYILIQVSIEGVEGLKEYGHNIPKERYHKTFKSFVAQVNSTPLDNLYVHFEIRTTVGVIPYISYFSNNNNVYKYFNYINKLERILAKCNNKNVDKHISSCRAIVKPVKCTTAQGKNISNILKKYNIKQHKDSLVHCTNIIPKVCECSEMTTALTFSYDGTILDCCSGYGIQEDEYINELPEDDRKCALIRRKMINNNRLIQAIKYNTVTKEAISNEILKEMALSQQVSVIYNNEDTRKYHIYNVRGANMCTRDNIETTGISFLTAPDFFRLYFNGVAEYITESRNDTIRT